MDWHHLRQQFPITENWIYFNHAAVAPISRAVQHAMVSLLDDVADHGLAHVEQWQAVHQDARHSVAGLIGAHADEICFLKNTTDGLITVALGFRWQRGDRIIIAEREFPANVYPWLGLAQQGVEVTTVPERDGRLCIDDFAAAIDTNTRVLSVSSVEFFTGFRNDLAALGHLCRDHDLLFVVDGIQSVGAMRIDVNALGIDCLAVDGHKWLMGPEGCAFFYCSRRALEYVQPPAIGWASVRTAYDFLDYDTQLQQDARRFETGSQNTVGIAGLKAAIDLLLGIGMDRVETRILMLTERLADGLSEQGFEILSSRRAGEASGIITCRPSATSTTTTARVAEHLYTHGVCITDRGGWLRFSPHGYNSEDEVDQVLDVLSSW